MSKNRSGESKGFMAGLSVIMLCLCSIGIVTGQTTIDERYAEHIERARDTLLQAMEQYGTPGASVTVSIDGEIVWSEGFGVASLELDVPVTPDTKFRIGSVSKALTAGAVALLVEEGKLDLDKPVQEYVPTFPKKGYIVTTRQLAGHLAGIRHYRGSEFFSQKRYASVEEGLDIFRDDSLLFEPGTRFSYSSYGFNLVSAAIEGASGKQFLDVMRDRIFEPLDMTATVPEYPDSIISNRSAFYFFGDTHTNAPTIDNSYKWAGGGFLSTTDDLIRFANEVMSGKTFSERSRALMFTSQRTSDGSVTSYSIGWTVRDSDGYTTISHGGGSIGGTAMLILVPAKNIAIAVLCNDDSRFTRSTSQALKLFLE